MIQVLLFAFALGVLLLVWWSTWNPKLHDFLNRELW